MSEDQTKPTSKSSDSRGCLIFLAIVFGLWVVGSNNSPTPPFAVQDKKSLFQINLPADWELTDKIGFEGDIQVRRRHKEAYCVVVTLPKKDLEEGVDLEELSARFREHISERIAPAKTDKDPEFVRINRRSAIHTEMSGKFEGTDIRCLTTTIQGNDHYYQIVAWTTASDPFTFGELVSVINSFTELPKPYSDKTESAKTDSAKTDSAKTDSAKTDSAKTESAKTESATTDSANTDSVSYLQRFQ